MLADVKKLSGSQRVVRPRTALVVEDDTTINATLAGLLEDDGFEVMTAATVERAKYILFESHHPVGVMVLDLGMPDGDGQTLLEEMYEHDDCCVPTVLVSGLPARASALASEYSIPYVGKPFDLQQVAATVAVSYDNDVRPHRRVVIP